MSHDHPQINGLPMDGRLAKRASTAALVFLLIALYVLSIGPAWCLRKSGTLPDAAFIVAYLPVLLPSEWSRYDDVLTAYRDWWLTRFG